MLFFNSSKKFFLILIFILVIIQLYKTFKKETKYEFNSKQPNKFIRYECLVGYSCGGWGKK